MGIIQQLDPMWTCAAGIAAICAFALVRFVWRHRIRNTAVVLLAAALAFTAIPKSNRQANGRAGSPLPAATTRDVSVETPHITAISLSTSGVDLVLYRPAFDSVSAVEVTVAAKTNIAEQAAWSAVTNATFLAGDTNAFAFLSRAMLDDAGITTPAFFSFGGSGDTDGDGLPDWHESLNLGTSPYLVDTDGDGFGDAEELAMGTDPTSTDTDGDGLSDLEEIGRISVLPSFEWHDTSSFPRAYGVPPPQGIESYSGAIASLLLPSGTSMLGFAFSRVVACDNGFVSLLLPEDWVSWSFPSPPHSLAIRGFNLGTVLVAPYWGQGRAEYGNPNSYICAGTLVDGTLVVEFHNVKCGFQSDDEMTYQVIVPCGAGSVVRVSYLSSDVWLDGTGAVVGVQNALRATPDGLYNLTWDFAARGPMLPGTTVEYRLGEGTDPLSPDSDGDGMDDYEECRISLSAPWSADGDEDGLLDGVEIILGTNPLKSDSDGDLLPDGWEFSHGLDPLSPVGVNGTFGDPDEDGLFNYREMQLGANPSDADTDGDGMPDGWEVQNSCDAVHAGADDSLEDPDGDGLTNCEEYSFGTDPHNRDSDGDGMGDGWEAAHGFDPAVHNGGTARTDDDGNADPDSDGADNLQEAEWGMDPFNASDGGMPADLVAVSFTFGDPSESQSEMYSLLVEPVGGGANAPRSYMWENPAEGACSTNVALLRRGWTYTAKLSHIGGMSGAYLDYDYVFICEAPDGVCVDDPDGMLGAHDDDDFQSKSGLRLTVEDAIPTATMSGMDVSVVAECDTVLFENGYVNAPGEVVARKSTWARVCVDFSSGTSSVQGLFMAASGGGKVILHEGSRVGAALDGVQTVELAPYSSRRILYYVEGCSPSEAVHDVLLAAQITDGGETCSSEASMTVGCVGLTAEYEVPSNRTRHVFGPAEPTRLSVVPQALLASFEVVGQIPHGGVVRNDDNTYTTNVSDRRSRFELGARHGNALLRLPFSVIEPERKFRAVNGRAIDADSWFSTTGDKPPPRVGQIGVGLYVELFLEPSYVSFKSLGTMELSCPATKLTGDFRGNRRTLSWILRSQHCRWGGKWRGVGKSCRRWELCGIGCGFIC